MLFVAGSLTDLRRLGSVVDAVKAHGGNASLHWFGGPPPSTSTPIDARHPLAADAGFAACTAAVAAVLAARPAVVVCSGRSALARAAAQCADAAGIAVAHVDGGSRSHSACDRLDGAGRAIDHVAALHLCATPLQQLNLVRESLPLERAPVCGSTLAKGLGAPAAAGDGRLLLWLDAGCAANVEAAVRSVADAQRLRPTRAEGDLAAIRGATAIVTDCADAQEAACALQVPCVTVTPFTARPETVDCGANQVAGLEPQAIARALAIALQRPRNWRSPYQNDLGAAVQALVALARPTPPAIAPAAAAPAGAPMALPSDGDASGRTLGYEECELATRAIRSGTLNSTKGTFVNRFEQAFAAYTGRKHAIACASGSAAVHCAINAIGLKAGDEVITTSVTDMGALTCILYEGAVPVFADVDPVTINVTAQTIGAQITPRTRAIVVTHLFGLACDMAPIMQLAKERNLLVIEDMAQAFGSGERTGRPGSFGALACYSLQQGKHMTTGEGGVVTTDDKDLARRVFLFVNKAWGYGDPKPDHYFPALNSRLTELQGAVAVAQLGKLDWVVERRRDVAARISAGLQGIPGLTLPKDPDGGRHSWWKYAFFVDPEQVEGGAVQLGKRMKDRGVFCVPRYIQKPAFECQLFQDFAASPVSLLPLEHNPRRQRPQPLFDRRDYPGTVRALDRVIVLPINELYTQQHVDYVTQVIRSEAKVLAHA